MNLVVLDASVLVALLFPETHSIRAAALLADLQGKFWEMLAPTVVRAEVLHVIRARMRRDRLPMTQAAVMLDRFLEMPVAVYEDAALYRHALTLTQAYSLTGYDALYVALADVQGYNLWSADERLLCGKRSPVIACGRPTPRTCKIAKLPGRPRGQWRGYP